MLTEFLADEPFPRIELEQDVNREVFHIAEAQAVPAYVLDSNARGLKLRLGGGIAQIFDGAGILGMVAYAAMDALARSRILSTLLWAFVIELK